MEPVDRLPADDDQAVVVKPGAVDQVAVQSGFGQAAMHSRGSSQERPAMTCYAVRPSRTRTMDEEDYEGNGARERT